MSHKAGFVNIIGNPNVGKSTLMNALVGEKLSIITSKAQTTRHRIMGIVNGEDFQIVYSDTPGIVNPAYKLHEGMMSFVETALSDADLLLYVVEAKDYKVKNEVLFDKLSKQTKPVFVVINKIDLLKEEEILTEFEYWAKLLPNARVLPISALHKANVDQLFSLIIKLLPDSPAFFPKDELTDKSMRFFASEIIREKIFKYYSQEIPYSCEVEIEFYHENTTPVHIGSIIYVERDTQKGIVIGKGGENLKRVGTEARRDIEAFLGKQIFLEMHVKVNKDWKNKPRELRRFGYLQT